MRKESSIIIKNGRQYIPDLQKATLKAPFRGRPEISKALVDEQAMVDLCPTNAIQSKPLRIDLGKCAFCGECAFAFPEKIRFTSDHLLATNNRESLVICEEESLEIKIDKERIRPEIKKIFSKSLKLRQVSAGGDNSCETELNACGNANFDMGRHGIEFVASPRHADGVVVTGPITENMAEALRIAWDAIPQPKLFILCGTDAISGGIFSESRAINRKILEEVHVDLWIPGNPPHPLTIINGLMDLTR